MSMKDHIFCLGLYYIKLCMYNSMYSVLRRYQIFNIFIGYSYYYKGY